MSPLVREADAPTCNILGVDPGFANFGLAVASLKGDGLGSLLYMNVLSTEKSTKKENSYSSEDSVRRASLIFESLASIVQQYAPVAICAESMSFPRSSSVSHKMGIGWGVLISVAASKNIPILHASPQAIKQAVHGTKVATKVEVKQGVLRVFGNHSIALVHHLAAGAHEHPFDAAAAILAQNSNPLIMIARKTLR